MKEKLIKMIHDANRELAVSNYLTDLYCHYNRGDSDCYDKRAIRSPSCYLRGLMDAYDLIYGRDDALIDDMRAKRFKLYKAMDRLRMFKEKMDEQTQDKKDGQ